MTSNTRPMRQRSSGCTRSRRMRVSRASEDRSARSASRSTSSRLPASRVADAAGSASTSHQRSSSRMSGRSVPALAGDISGVESVEPAQHFGRAVAGACPLPIARFLSRAVGKVKADLVRARHFVKAGDAWPAHAFIAVKRVGDVGAASDQTGGQGGAILDGLRRALAHERIHRVARVAEQGRAADRPPRQWLAIEQGPDEARIRGGDDPPHLGMPALERGERAGDRRAIGPVLAVPRVVLGPADEVQQSPARDEVVHEVPAGTDPRLGADLEPEVGDALDRYQATIGDAAREARRLLAEQRGAHRGVDAVRADQQVDRDSAAVLEPGLDAVILVGEADQAVAQMHALGRKGRRDDCEQVGAVNGEMRSAVQLLAPRVQWRALERAAVLPAPLMRADRPDGVAVERLAEAEPVEDPHRVRAHVDAAADLGPYRRLLVDIDVEAALMKPDGRREAADPGADDGDPDYGVSLVPPVLGKDALHIRDATARSHPPLGVAPVLIGGLL